MRPTVGIVCEYDPFHRGHARQFVLVREALPEARIICAMSGCFTQRGMPALFAPAFRAQAAMRAGASLVLELPCAFAVREAENFALGAVGLLDALGFVTHLSFGCETADLPLLTRLAALLEEPAPAYTAALKAALAEGKPFVQAQALAAVEAFAQVSVTTEADALPPDAEGLAQTLRKPNNILAICYLRALRRLHSPILPLPVVREGAYHAATLDAEGYPSASATRAAYLRGDLAAAQAACGYPLAGALCHPPAALDPALIDLLRRMPPEALRALPDCTEGLENRLQRAARQAATRRELLIHLKTRRYAYARLNRLATHALLGVTAQLLRDNPRPSYARLLGFDPADREALALLKQGGLPILAKAAHGDAQNPLYALDARAYDLWALGAGLPAGLMYRQAPVQPNG